LVCLGYILGGWGDELDWGGLFPLFFLELGEDNIWLGGGDGRDGELCSGRIQASAKGCDPRAD
jgi:hypothetical protein